MGFYNKYIFPKVLNWACKQKPAMKQREKIIPLAAGNVLEIGVGSGLNLPFYDSSKVAHLSAIDPAVEIWNERRLDMNQLPIDFEFIQSKAEEMPFNNNSFDTIVFTYTLCSIADLERAFEEIRRVIKPNGQLIFCEHGKAPDISVRRWQNTINPIWKRFGGGCNLNRDIPVIIKENGFTKLEMETMYIPGWKPASFNYWGTALCH